MDQSFNGYSNIDTWRVMLWINNHKPAYDKMRKLTPDHITSINDIRQFKKTFNIINHLYWSFGYVYDRVAWDQVNLNEIKDELKKYLMEELKNGE